MNAEEAERILEIVDEQRGPMDIRDFADAMGMDYSRGVYSKISAAYWYFEKIGKTRESERIARTLMIDGRYKYKD